MRFRQKISFIAFKKKMTIVELFMNALKKTFNELLRDGLIQYSKSKMDSDEVLWREITQNQSMKGLFQALMLANRNKFFHSHLTVATKLSLRLNITKMQKKQN